MRLKADFRNLVELCRLCNVLDKELVLQFSHTESSPEVPKEVSRLSRKMRKKLHKYVGAKFQYFYKGKTLVCKKDNLRIVVDDNWKVGSDDKGGFIYKLISDHARLAIPFDDLEEDLVE